MAPCATLNALLANVPIKSLLQFATSDTLTFAQRMATNGRPESLTDDLSDSLQALNIASGNEVSSFRKWFQWCINALSFRCLRQQKHSRHSDTNDYCPVRRASRQTEANVETIDTRQLSDPLAFCGYADAFQTNVAYSTMDEPRASKRRVEPPTVVLHVPVPDTPKKQGPWSSDEHNRYCEGLEMFRFGSWKLIANYVGTRSEHQVMSHAQSLRAKRKRGEEREQREKDLGSLSHKNARTGDARTQMLSAEELLVNSMSMPLPATNTTRSSRSFTVFSPWCLRSQSVDKPQATVYLNNLYSPGIFDTESLRPRPIATRNYAGTRSERQVMSQAQKRGDVFSLRCLRSQSVDKPQATVYKLYSPLRPRPIATRGAIFLPPVDEDDSDMRLARQAAEQIEWYNSRVPRSAPNIAAIEKKTGPWTKEEHERYCEALEMYRYGSWKLIADYVRTRTDRQVMSHAQSIRAKRKRAEKREEHQKMTKDCNPEQTGVPTKLAKTTAGGRIDPLTGNTTPTTDTPSQEARHSLELPDETATELSSTSKAGEAFDTPLCSPPPDILIGSFLSDEDFFELTDPLSPLTGETFTL